MVDLANINYNRSKSTKKLLIGRFDWPKSIWKNPAYDGMIVAMPDQSSLALVSDRFQKVYSRPMSISAAYAYDVVALALGLVRVKGLKTISRNDLEQETGFRGATGVFKFRPDGSVERLYRIMKAQQKALVVIQEIPAGF